ncbi:MAG: methylthioribulose 1-phosphate dehydratase [Wenzhouxiangellaceae bacterium]|nr:methylthioribulose 1-phosphate dehydratase [Wenzhouxiangellaceae bacterium]
MTVQHRTIAKRIDSSAQPRVRELIAVARDFGARGWTPATSGNYSVRLPDGRLLVSRSGVDKRVLAPADLMVMDRQGLPSGADRASAEAALHAQIYAARPQVNAVLHVHSTSATVASRRVGAGGSVILKDFELLKALEGIETHAAKVELPVVANDQDMSRLAASAAPFLAASGACPGYLIAGHGLYAWGREVADAARHMEALDFMLNCYLMEST